MSISSDHYTMVRFSPAKLFGIPREIKRLPEEPTKNLQTGEGHGHFRPLERKRPKKDRRLHKQKKRKIAKASRRRNRK